LLWAVEGLRTERDSACQECANTRQWIDLLEGELEEERGLKVEAKGVTIGLAMEVSQRQEEIRGLEAEVIRQREEVRNLRVDVKGKPTVSLVVLLLRIHSWPFDIVDV
jgi:hypothetical protein